MGVNAQAVIQGYERECAALMRRVIYLEARVAGLEAERVSPASEGAGDGVMPGST
jgi:hypothetical protein